MGVDYIGYAYAATVAAGGIVGFAKAQSIPSLAAGLVFGGILTFGAYQLSQNPNNYFVSLGASTILTTLMGYRYISGGKFMPAGLITVISLANMVRMGHRHLVPVKIEE